MGLLRKREQEPGGGSGLELDLDLRSCPICRRDLHPWEPTCPNDGTPAVPRHLLTSNIPPPPAHLLADDEAE
jgi:D-arabinose 1-dehydrogenase-like Zn-dependent alcohol dehydrogenase